MPTGDFVYHLRSRSVREVRIAPSLVRAALKEHAQPVLGADPKPPEEIVGIGTAEIPNHLANPRHLHTHPKGNVCVGADHTTSIRNEGVGVKPVFEILEGLITVETLKTQRPMGLKTQVLFTALHEPMAAQVVRQEQIRIRIVISRMSLPISRMLCRSSCSEASLAVFLGS